MEQIIELLKNPIVGSLIGILGIVIGAILAVVFYLAYGGRQRPLVRC